jgi:MFS family permease
MFFLFLGVGVAAAFQVGKAPPALPAIRADLGLSLYLAGWVLSTFNALGVVLAPAAGAIADWLGHRRMMLVGLGFMGLGSAVGSLAHGAPVLLASRCMESLGYILVSVSASGLIVRVVRQVDLRFAMGVWSTFMPFGAALMMLLAPLALAGFGWRGMWQANAGLLFAMLLLLAWATRDLKTSVTRRKRLLSRLGHDVLRTWKTPGPVLVALCFGSYGFQFLVVFGFLPTMLIEELGLTQTSASILTAISVFLCVPANMLGGWLLQRGVAGWLLIAISSALASLSCFGVYAESASVPFRFLSAVFFMTVGSLLPPAAMHGAVVHAPSRELVATSYGILIQGTQLGSLTGPPIAAAVVSRKGDWQAASWILCLVGMIGVASSLWLRSIERRKAATLKQSVIGNP